MNVLMCIIVVIVVVVSDPVVDYVYNAGHKVTKWHKIGVVQEVKIAHNECIH